MKHTRSTITLILVGVTAALLAVGGAAVANAAEGPPQNRGWSTSTFAEFTDD